MNSCNFNDGNSFSIFNFLSNFGVPIETYGQYCINMHYNIFNYEFIYKSYL